MNRLTSGTILLADKLQMAGMIYERSASQIKNHLGIFLGKKAEKKKQFLNDLENVWNYQKEGNRLNTDLLASHIENIFVQLSDADILIFCIKREEELTSMYQTLLRTEEFEERAKRTLQNQLNESQELIKELKAMKYF